MQITFNNITVEIPNHILKCFYDHEQYGHAHECGGILLGKKLLCSDSYIITLATLPNSKDLSGPSFFVRNKEAAQQVLEDNWECSDGIINYLGEWHTHRCKKPKPSSTDKRLIQQIINDKVSPYGIFFMIIVGQKKNLYIEAVDTRSKNSYSTQINYEGLVL